MTAASATSSIVGRETRVIGLISFAHLLSHLYMLALPPLFPAIRADLGVTYTELGISITVFAIATGVLQTPMGFLCQRIGARPVLIGGLLLNGAAIALVAFASEFWHLCALMFLAGVGSSVFHPADYAILSGSVDKSRVGRAFAVHTFGGTAGFAIAPAVMVGLAAIGEWRFAVLMVGGVGVALSLVILALSGVIGESGVRAKEERKTGWRELLGSRPIVLFFLFYVGMAGSNAGVTMFGVAAMTEGFGLDLALANLALTVYLFATMAGVLPGGWLADKTRRHTLVLLTTIGGAAAMVALVALGIPFWLAVAMLAGAGFLRGLVNATRDVMVRDVAKGIHVGTVFAFVTTGFLAGQAVSPAIYGVLLDIGSPEVVFWASAGFSILCLATLFVPGVRGRSA